MCTNLLVYVSFLKCTASNNQTEKNMLVLFFRTAALLGFFFLARFATAFWSNRWEALQGVMEMGKSDVGTGCQKNATDCVMRKKKRVTLCKSCNAMV